MNKEKSYWQKRCEAAELIIGISGTVDCEGYEQWQTLKEQEPASPSTASNETIEEEKRKMSQHEYQKLAQGDFEQPKYVQQAAKEEMFRGLFDQFCKEAFEGSGINIPYTAIGYFKKVLAGASFNSKVDGKEDQYWSQAISMIEVADTDGNDYLQKYDELHKKLKSKFTITSNKNEIQQAHDKSTYE